MFVRRFFPLQSAWRIVDGQTARVFVIYFAAHCAGVTNMSSRHNLSPLWRYIADIGVWDQAAPAEKTTDLSDSSVDQFH